MGTGERQSVLTLTQVALGLQVLGAGCEYWNGSESLEAQSVHMYVCEEAYLSRHGCLVCTAVFQEGSPEHIPSWWERWSLFVLALVKTCSRSTEYFLLRVQPWVTECLSTKEGFVLSMEIRSQIVWLDS